MDLFEQLHCNTNYQMKTFRTVDRPIHGIAVIVPIEEQENPPSNEISDLKNSTLNPTAAEYVPKL